MHFPGTDRSSYLTKPPGRSSARPPLCGQPLVSRLTLLLFQSFTPLDSDTLDGIELSLCGSFFFSFLFGLLPHLIGNSPPFPSPLVSGPSGLRSQCGGKSLPPWTETGLQGALTLPRRKREPKQQPVSSSHSTERVRRRFSTSSLGEHSWNAYGHLKSPVTFPAPST